MVDVHKKDSFPVMQCFLLHSGTTATVNNFFFSHSLASSSSDSISELTCIRRTTPLRGKTSVHLCFYPVNALDGDVANTWCETIGRPGGSLDDPVGTCWRRCQYILRDGLLRLIVGEMTSWRAGSCRGWSIDSSSWQSWRCWGPLMAGRRLSDTDMYTYVYWHSSLPKVLCAKLFISMLRQLRRDWRKRHYARDGELQWVTRCGWLHVATVRATDLAQSLRSSNQEILLNWSYFSKLGW